MAYFDRQRASVLRSLRKGEEVIWRQLTKTENAAAPWDGATFSGTDHSVRICFLPVEKDTYETYRSFADVATFSMLGYMGTVNFEPKVADVVIRNGVVLRIAYIDVLKPNEESTLLYTVLFK